MNNPNIKSSEEYLGRVTIFLTNGHNVEFETEKLITFIKENKLNVTDTYGGNSGCGEPWNDNDTIEETEDVEKYLDDNFDKIVEQYYKVIICKA